MQAPGPPQIELIRRYARTLRHLQAEGGRFSRPGAGRREQPLQREADRVAEVLDGGGASAMGPRATVV